MSDPWRFVVSNDPTKARDVLKAGRPTARFPGVSAKVLGGNITVKGGFDWRHLWAEWDWDNWIKPQVDRAVKLGLRGIRLIGSASVMLSGTTTWSTWAGSTAYAVDDTRVKGSRVYRCTTAGTSASSGGPTGTGSSITDGTAVWEYVRQDDLSPLTQDQYDAHWAQLVEYCASQGLYLYACLCEKKNFDWAGAAQYQNADMTESIVATAEKLSAYPNVCAFDIFQEGDDHTGLVWAASTSYAVGAYVNNGGKSYIATTAGTSASSGGPSGTGTSITDGSVVWDYVGVPLLPADVLALLAAIRAVSNVPIGMSTPNRGFNFWRIQPDIWNSVLTADNGPDFIDLHLYETLNSAWMTASLVELYAATYGKPVMVGEYGIDQSLSGGSQTERLSMLSTIFARPTTIGAFAWALADQGHASVRQAGIWDNTGFATGASPAALSTSSGQRSEFAAALRKLPVSQPATSDQAYLTAREDSYDYTNLVAGSNFETTHPWLLGNKWSVSTAQHDSGSASLLCVSGGADKCTLKHDFEVTNGDRIYVQLRVRRDSSFNGTAGNCKVRISDQGDSSIGQVTFGLTDLVSADTWTTISGYVDIGSSTTKIKVALWYCDHTAGNVWLDNIVIRRGVRVSNIIASTTSALGVGSLELGHASDTTLTRSSAGKLAVEGVDVVLTGGALGTPASGTLTNCTGLPVAGVTASTSTALGVGSIELGHASDTTLSRSAAGDVAVEGVSVLTASNSKTVTNKRVSPRVTTLSSASTLTPDSDASDEVLVASLATNATIAAPTGTPTDGQFLRIRFIDDGTGRTLTWNAVYNFVRPILAPANTGFGPSLYVDFVWNAATSKWDCVANSFGKRAPRTTGSVSSTATMAPNVDYCDFYDITALAVDATINAPSGTPVNGMPLMIRIKDNGSTRNLSWNSAYQVIGVTLPTATTAGKWIYVSCIYNSTASKWDVISVQQQA